MSDFIQVGTRLLAQAEADGGLSHGPIDNPVNLGFAFLLLLAVLFGLMISAKQGLAERVFRKRVTSYSEQVYLFLENMCVGTIGAHGRKYIPMIMTFWMIIFIGNLLALFMPFSPTASLSFNLGMAIIVVFYVQWEGIQANGFFGHLKHFAGPKLDWYMFFVTVLLLGIELISEMMKNLSLSLRLYGNMHGGHLAVEAMNRAGEGINIGGMPLPIPFGEFLLPIKLLTCLVQAMIFCLLTCVYLSMVTHHAEESFEGYDEVAAAH